MYEPILQPFSRTVTSASVSDWRNGVLIRSTNWLGDALMTLPAVWQLKQCLPQEVPLSVLAPDNLLPVWKACPFVHDVIPMKGKRLSSEEVQTVRDRRFGAAAVFPNSFGSAWDIWRTGIPVRVGRRGRFRSFFLTHGLPEWPRGENVGNRHQLSYYLELASAFGAVRWETSCPPLTVDKRLAEELGMTEKDRWLAMAPGAAYGPAKQWPPEYFRKVADSFSRRGWRIVVVGGANDRAAAEKSVEGVSASLNVAGRTNLGQLMSVLSMSTAVLSNDSGPMHLAAALGKSGVAVFGSTDPVGTGPVGGNWTLMVSEESCRPCFRRQCPRTGTDAYACLKGIETERVIWALDDAAMVSAEL